MAFNNYLNSATWIQLQNCTIITRAATNESHVCTSLPRWPWWKYKFDSVIAVCGDTGFVDR